MHGLRGWRFARLAVCAVGGLRGLRFAVGFLWWGWRFAVEVLRFTVCGWRFAVGVLRLAFCGWRFAVGILRWAFCGGRFVVGVFQSVDLAIGMFAFLGTPNNEFCIHLSKLRIAQNCNSSRTNNKFNK